MHEDITQVQEKWMHGPSNFSVARWMPKSRQMSTRAKFLMHSSLPGAPACKKKTRDNATSALLHGPTISLPVHPPQALKILGEDQRPNGSAVHIYTCPYFIPRL